MLWRDGPPIPGISRSGHYEQLCFQQDLFFPQGNPLLLAEFNLETEGPVQVQTHAHTDKYTAKQNACVHTDTPRNEYTHGQVWHVPGDGSCWAHAIAGGMSQTGIPVPDCLQGSIPDYFVHHRYTQHS
jgi:hypothetical protein